MSDEVYGALKILKNYCMKHERCKQCDFYDSKYGTCRLMNRAPEDYLRED